MKWNLWNIRFWRPFLNEDFHTSHEIFDLHPYLSHLLIYFQLGAFKSLYAEIKQKKWLCHHCLQWLLRMFLTSTAVELLLNLINTVIHRVAKGINTQFLQFCFIITAFGEVLGRKIHWEVLNTKKFLLTQEVSVPWIVGDWERRW